MCIPWLAVQAPAADVPVVSPVWPPVFARKAKCDNGYGMTVVPQLDVVVVSNNSDMKVRAG